MAAKAVDEYNDAQGVQTCAGCILDAMLLTSCQTGACPGTISCPNQITRKALCITIYVVWLSDTAFEVQALHS